jgi:hypothetical protein
MLATAFVVVLGLALSCGSITKDELSCEQAVSKLSDCCPALDTRGLPCVDSSGCNGQAKPVLSTRASSCILATDCSVYQARGSCDGIISFALVPHSMKNDDVIENEVCQ